MVLTQQAHLAHVSAVHFDSQRIVPRSRISSTIISAGLEDWLYVSRTS